MFSAAVILICAVFLVAYCWTFIRLNGGIRLTPFLITITSIFLLNMVGVGFVAIGWTQREFADLEYAYGLELVIHVFLTSLLFLFSAMAFKRLKWPTIAIVGEREESFQNALKYSMMGFGVIGVLIFGMYLLALDTIPIISVLRGGASQFSNALLRSSATNNFSGDYWRFNTAITYILPFVSWFFLIRFVKYRGKLDLRLFLVFFAVAAFAAVVSIQKAPIIMYLGLTYLVYLMAKGERFSLKNIIIIVGIAIVVIPILYITFMNVQDQGLLLPLVKGLNRAFVGQIYPGLYYLDAFPKNVDFLYGTSLPNPGGLLWHDAVNHAQLLWRLFFPEYGLRGMQGSLNTIYIMDGYANFGYLGMYLIALIAGALVMIISKFLETISMDELRIPLMFLVSKELMKLGMTTFSQVFINFSMYLFLIILTLCILSIPIILRWLMAWGRFKGVKS